MRAKFLGDWSHIKLPLSLHRLDMTDCLLPRGFDPIVECQECILHGEPSRKIYPAGRIAAEIPIHPFTQVSYSRIDRIDFRDADLRHVLFYHCYFAPTVIWDNATLDGARFEACTGCIPEPLPSSLFFTNLRGYDLRKMRFPIAYEDGDDISRASGVDSAQRGRLERQIFTNNRGQSFACKDVTFYRCLFIGCNYRNSTFTTDTVFEECCFINCNFYPKAFYPQVPKLQRCIFVPHIPIGFMECTNMTKEWIAVGVPNPLRDKSFYEDCICGDMATLVANKVLAEPISDIASLERVLACRSTAS